mmetsp:Transcript_23527/g.54822  ORF Transcript_23527/g.54822 Transcript_23527/m.54822 type:complete len:222 (-) Transcript_23527:19-684(-)
MNPSISCFKTTGRFPIDSKKVRTFSTGLAAPTAVCFAGHSSTSGTRCAGPMKWAAILLAAPFLSQAPTISDTESDDVFVQRIADAGVSASSSLNIACLAPRSSTIDSKTISALATASGSLVDAMIRPVEDAATPLDFRKPRSSSAFALPRSAASALLPHKHTSWGPPAAMEAAMPQPIMPGPMTATFIADDKCKRVDRAVCFRRDSVYRCTTHWKSLCTLQ